MATDVGRKGDYIQTFSGRHFWPVDPRPDEVNIRDIAHSLSRICHFNGHVRVEGIFSVAQHSVLVSRVLDEGNNGHLALTGLLHDAPEAYICDLPRPLKRQPELAAYNEIEERIFVAVAQKFGLLYGITWEVTEADNRVLLAEARDFMGDPDWAKEMGRILGVEPYEKTLDPLTPREAEDQFMSRFVELISR